MFQRRSHCRTTTQRTPNVPHLDELPLIVTQHTAAAKALLTSDSRKGCAAEHTGVPHSAFTSACV